MKRAILILIIALVALMVGVKSWRSKPPLADAVSTVVEQETVPVLITPRPTAEYRPLRAKASEVPLATLSGQPMAATNLEMSPPITAPPAESNVVIAGDSIEASKAITAMPTNRAADLCRSNMVAIIWAANVWCGAHRDLWLPRDLMLLTNELESPLLLLCPTAPDWLQNATTNWADFRRESITYRTHVSAVKVNVSVIYLYCPVHKRWQPGDHPAPPGGWGPWWSSQNRYRYACSQ